jgi:phosphoglycolate phosphatase
MRDLTLVFDLDGTLVETAPDLIAATNHALSDLGLAPVGGDLLKPWIGFGARRMIVEGLRESGRELAEPDVDRLLGRFLAYYEANIAAESYPFPGAVAALSKFRSAGARLAVCTNKREKLSKELLATLDLDHLFGALAGRDTFPVSKPHPDHLLGAIRMVGGDARRAIMIGDTSVDIDTARAARVPVIACSFGYSDTPVRELGPDAVIDHFDELDPAIAAVMPNRLPIGSR